MKKLPETNFEMVVEFNEKFGGAQNLQRQFELVLEELQEVLREIPNVMCAHSLESLFSEEDVARQFGALVKELVDLLYVTYGMFYVLKVHADTAFEMVHDSNMSKVGEDGKPIKDEKTGKILKGPNYKPVDLLELYRVSAEDFYIHFESGDWNDE